MRIGIDLDNTIINYQSAFVEKAKQNKLVEESFSGSKTALRDVLIGSGRDKAWQTLQGYIYGPGIQEAELFPGVLDFLSKCKTAGHQLYIVSHKTKYGHFDKTKTDLRKAALGFLSKNAVLDTLVKKEDIYFRSTREEKLVVIDNLELDYFIDDLPEVLLAPSFPRKTKRVHFSPEGRSVDFPEGSLVCSVWADILCQVTEPLSHEA